MDLKGKTALVTGASRGIGKAIALELAAMGAGLALVARNVELLKSVAEEAQSLGATAIYQDIDLERQAAYTIFAAWLKDLQVDILINNAGVYSTDHIALDQASTWDDADPSGLWKSTLEVNLTAPYRLAKMFAPGMVERTWGRIINISSISGQKAEAYGAAYSASKFGLIGITQALALELARHGITVNSVCPGWVETDMATAQINDPEWCRLNQIDPEDSIDIARLAVPQMRFIQPDEVAGLVSFLCSDRAKGITGQAINICGGLSIT